MFALTYNNINLIICHYVLQVEVMEQKIREMTVSIGSYEEKKQKLECDLRASIDKIYDLREIISVLEKQMETKSKSEHVLNEKIKVFYFVANCVVGTVF